MEPGWSPLSAVSCQLLVAKKTSASDGEELGRLGGRGHGGDPPGAGDPRRATVTRAAGTETLADRPPMPRRVGRDQGILRKMMKSEEIYTTFLPVVQIV